MCKSSQQSRYFARYIHLSKCSLAIILLLWAVVAHGQILQVSNPYPTRRAISVEVTATPSLYRNAHKEYEWSSSYGGAIEYGFPDSKLSLRAGYLHDTFTFGGSSLGYSLKTLELGGRYYFNDEHHWFQPYVGLGAGWIFDADPFGTWSPEYAGRYGTNYYTSFLAPSFSLAPRVGMSVEILSGLSLTVGYGLRMPFGGRFSLSNMHGAPTYSSGHGPIHEASIGLSVAFPRFGGSSSSSGLDLFHTILHVVDLFTD